MSSPVYLVVEPIEIIAYDLAMCVSEYDQTATIIVALTLAAGCEILKGHPAVRLAFVHTDPAKFSDTELAHCLEIRGAKMVFIGDAAERNDKSALVLHRPFSAETAAELLTRIEASEPV